MSISIIHSFACQCHVYYTKYYNATCNAVNYLIRTFFFLYRGLVQTENTITHIHSSQLRLIPYLHHTSFVLRQLPLEQLSEIFNEGGIKIIPLTNIRPIIIYFHSSQCRLIPYLHQRPIFFKANSIHSSIVVILELICGAQCLIEVIRSSGEEM